MDQTAVSTRTRDDSFEDLEEKPQWVNVPPQQGILFGGNCAQLTELALLVAVPGVALASSIVFYQMLSVVLGLVVYLLVVPVLVYRLARFPTTKGARVFSILYVLMCTVLLCVEVVYLFKPFYATFHGKDFVLLGSLTESSIKMTVFAENEYAFVVDTTELVNNSAKRSFGPFLFENGDYLSMGYASLSSLHSNTEFEYQVSFITKESGESGRPQIKGSFRTLPAQSEKRTITFASTSCTSKNRRLGGIPLSGYERISEKADLDFLLFLGDVIYTDVPYGMGYNMIGYGSDKSLYDWDYRNTALDPYMKEFTRHVPVAWMFDDHEILNDYDEGNATRVFETALFMWEKYMGKTTFPARNPSAGRQYTFEVGAASFYMLDTRSQRSGDTGVLIGSEQLADVKGWLLERQAAQPRSFKFLVSPVPMTINHPSEDGGWNCRCPDCEPLSNSNKASCPNERDVVLDFIVANNITGVVVISGDTHKPGVFELRKGVLELSVSPLSAVSPPLWNANADKTIFEQTGMTTVFAIYDLSDFELNITIYGGGDDVPAQIGLIITGTMAIGWLIAVALSAATKTTIFPSKLPNIAILGLSALLLAGCIPWIYFALPWRTESQFENPIFQHTISV